MPRSQPHPSALFSLKSLNPRAKAVVNRHDRLASRSKEGDIVLDVGQTRSMSGDDAVLVTLGRNGDIQLDGSSIAKIQCAFEINMATKVVMFYDRSHSQTSQVFGENATPFEYGRSRKVVVQKRLNTLIGLGGVGRNMFQFELKWHCEPAQAMEAITNRACTAFEFEDNPCLAQTVDETDTVIPSQRETRPHTAGPQQPTLRHANINELGSGEFGTVHKPSM